MPVIFVYGIPTTTDSHTLESLLDALRKTAASVEELHITKNDVSVFFPKDLVEEGLGEEIILFIEGLLDKPERTATVRKTFAQALANCTGRFFPKTKMIECFIKPFDAQQGFCRFRQ
jgi:hypothetical protein